MSTYDEDFNEVHCLEGHCFKNSLYNDPYVLTHLRWCL
jgi:hypothetical protein